MNFSVLDGWWDECFDGENGWEITTSNSDDPVERDIEEAETVYRILTTEIIPLFYQDGSRPSAEWLKKVRHNWKTLGPFVTAGRMVKEYDRRIYRPNASC